MVLQKEMVPLLDATVKNQEELKELRRYLQNIRNATGRYNEKVGRALEGGLLRFDESLKEIEGAPVALPRKMDEISAKVDALNRRLEKAMNPKASHAAHDMEAPKDRIPETGGVPGNGPQAAEASS